MVTLDPAAPLADAFTQAVSDALSGFLDTQARALAAIDPLLAPLVERARVFTAGGKRLRPAFCAWGYAAAHGELALPEAVVRAAASLDLLHVSALVHDDVMDASDSRRGVPAAHLQFAADHTDRAARGDADAFGRAGAILLGDLLLMWSEEMFRTAGLDAVSRGRARPHLEAMRTEVTAGQYLDVLAQSRHPYPAARTASGLEELRRLVSTVVTWKSASYTVRRPLLLGATLAGADDAAQDALTAVGQPLGRAFQYRDDVLGVFGDAALTGKTSAEDLREGKLTLLAIEAFARADERGAAELATLFGNPRLDAAGAARARALITDSGALEAVEAHIDREFAAALSALDAAPIAEPARDGLAALAHRAVRRSY